MKHLKYQEEMIMHLEIESTVIAAANPEGQVSFFRLFPIYHLFWKNTIGDGGSTAL